ncbi:MAG: M28 family peptidase [Anaerolineae bacterium]|nr:M28 family peptidase [Anaerolineae bacterium]
MYPTRFLHIVMALAMVLTLLTACQPPAAPAPVEAPPAAATQPPPPPPPTEPPPPPPPDIAALKAAYLAKTDVKYAYDLALKVSQEGNGPQGFRNAGSPAEQRLAEMLYQEMKAIGLQDVRKDAFPVDAWTYKGVTLNIQDKDGNIKKLALAPYSSATFQGTLEAELVDVGTGTKPEYEGKDVEGKIVLADVDMWNLWWVSFPTLEAQLHGAAAIIFTHTGYYAQKDDVTLNSFDFAGPTSIPSFSIGRGDMKMLREMLAQGKVTATLEGENIIEPGESYNVIGYIPGKKADEYIIVGDHYDGYFYAFEDNATGVAAPMAIAKALIDSGYQPERTLVFVLHGSEEYGVQNSRYDWCTGAWYAAFKQHPEWQGKALAYINFEMPGLRVTEQVVSSPHLKSYLESFIQTLNPPKDKLPPEGITVSVPVFTWSDDFSYDIAGIPALRPKFNFPEFENQIYHSQYDLPDIYDETAMDWHIKMYGELVIDLDQSPALALNPADHSAHLLSTLNADAYQLAGVDIKPLEEQIGRVEKLGKEKYEQLAQLNQAYADLIKARSEGKAVDAALLNEIRAAGSAATAAMLKAFRTTEDGLVRLTWIEVPIYPHEQPQSNILALDAALTKLKAGNAQGALDEDLWTIEDEWYSMNFSREVIDQNMALVLQQSEERTTWGTGRIVGYVDLYDTLWSLKAKAADPKADLSAEIAELEAVQKSQFDLLAKTTADEIKTLKDVESILATVNVQQALEKAQAALK